MAFSASMRLLAIAAAAAAAVVAISLVRPASADLPVHCLHEQVSGVWTFEMSDNNGDSANTHCGHKVPDTNLDHFSKEGFNLQVVRKMRLNLTDPNVAHVLSDTAQSGGAAGETGTWTMVYDEGFHILLPTIRMFAFSAYVPKTPESLSKDDVEDYVSHCGSTLVGWFHAPDNSGWGCYHGVRESSNSKHHHKKGGAAGARFAEEGHRHELKKVLAPSAMQAELSASAEDSNDGTMVAAVAPISNSGVADEEEEDLGADDVDDDTTSEDPEFSPDLEFIELVNSNPESSWKAGVPPFSGMKMTEAMRKLGYRPRASLRPAERISLLEVGEERHRHTHRHRHSHSTSLLEVGEERHQHTHRHRHSHRHGSNNHHNRRRRQQKKEQQQSDAEKYAGLPTNFSWRNKDGQNYMPPVRNQANCGSCFAMATISAVEARVRIQSDLKDTTLLSPQAVLSCSGVNQGCDGGYPYLVGMHGQEFGFVPEACMPYSGTNGQCVFEENDGCDPNNPTTYLATNYTYIGGYYGACTEVAMMHEIMENGPIIVAFDAPSSLFYYSGGVFKDDGTIPSEGKDLPGLHRWEKTNHAVVAAGWGVENGDKYWLIQNTWGSDWGEEGFFRILRGHDQDAIASMAVSVQVALPTK